MKLLIIEDDKEISTFLKANLSNSGFVVDATMSGQSGLNMAQENIYDLIILDLNLPDMNGQHICQELRRTGKMMPILVLSANSQIKDKTELLDQGADDYMIKPFSYEELVARLNALARRPKEISNEIISIQDLKLDKQKQTVYRANKEIYLTRKEFLLLDHLMSHPNTVISRGEIMEHVWDMEADIFSKTIETHILNLRKKIDTNRRHPLIKTISGRGYKFA